MVPRHFMEGAAGEGVLQPLEARGVRARGEVAVEAVELLQLVVQQVHPFSGGLAVREQQRRVVLVRYQEVEVGAGRRVVQVQRDTSE